MRRFWELTEQMLVIFGVGLIALQISFLLEYYILAVVLAVCLIGASGMLMLQYYDKKRR